MKQIVLLFSLTAITMSVFAQPKKVVADKIIAQVGDKIGAGVRQHCRQIEQPPIGTLQYCRRQPHLEG